jgi:hypothetical protein
MRSLVGLDRNAAKEAFGQFLDENRYTSQQIRFVEMVIDRSQPGITRDSTAPSLMPTPSRLWRFFQTPIKRLLDGCETRFGKRELRRSCR